MNGGWTSINPTICCEQKKIPRVNLPIHMGRIRYPRGISFGQTSFREPLHGSGLNVKILSVPSLGRLCQLIYCIHTYIRTYVHADLHSFEGDIAFFVDRITILADCIPGCGGVLVPSSCWSVWLIPSPFCCFGPPFSGNSILCLAVSLLILQLFMLCIVTCCQ